MTITTVEKLINNTNNISIIAAAADTSIIDTAIKSAVNEMMTIAAREHSSEEYFAPLDEIRDLVDILMDQDAEVVYASQWAQAFVVAAFEHSFESIVNQNAQLGNPDWDYEDVQAEEDRLSDIDVREFGGFVQAYHEWRGATTALPGHQHVLEVLNSVQKNEDRRLLGMKQLMKQ